ncbi:MAG: AAA family ATPase, partial [Geminicoccales bacterium]
MVGETPNLAARLQSMAEPDMVVIAQRTRHLLGSLFELSDLGLHALKGFAEPLRAWAVVGEGQAESRFEAMHGTILTPLVGREHELGILLERWSWASEGDGQVVLLAGEPGIGKSRMIRALREQLGDGTYILSHYGSPYHQNSSLHPVIACLQRAAKLDRSEPPERQLDKLEALLARSAADLDEALPLIGSLLSLPYETRYPPLTLSPQRQKQRVLEVLVDQIEALTRDRPVLALFEDAHWIDPSTLEFLGLVIERAQRLRALVVVTFRPEFTPPWSTQAHATLLPLNRLGRRQGAAMVEGLSGGQSLPPEIRDEIVAKTDGVPLFLEELTKAVLESGLLGDAQTGPLPPLAIPATLHDSLMARLDRLAPVKEVAQIGAAIGREFSYQLLAAVAPLAERNLQEVLQQLIDAELVFRRGSPPEATYSFKHALVQEAAYGSLLRSRRQQLHARIATVLEPQDGVEPELLAHHYTHAGLAERAVDYWQKAGQRASARSAAAEAVGHLTRGLECLTGLPDNPARRRKELDLQTMLGGALIAAKGYAADETGRAFARARELAGELEDGPQLFPVLFGQYLFRLLRGELTVAHEVGQEMVRLAERQQDTASLLIAHRTLGTNLFWLGRPAPALTHIDQALALYDPAQHTRLTEPYTFHPRVLGLDFKSLILFVLGYPDQARETGRRALAEAREAQHLVTLAAVLQHGCIIHQLQGDLASMG